MLTRRRAWLAPAALATLLAYGVVSPLTVAADPPTVVGDAITVDEDSGQSTIDVLGNDDPDLTIVDASNPAHGTVVIAGNGLTLTYEPEADYNGLDSFTYTVENATAEQSTANVDVTVTSVNDAPVAVDDPATDCEIDPVFFGGSFPIPEDYHGPLTISDSCGLLANDSDIDGDVLTWALVDNATHGTAAFVSAAAFSYQPDNDYSTVEGDLPGGNWVSDSFTYQASDGTAASNVATMRIWVAPVNDPPTFSAGPSTVTVAEDSGAHSHGWATNVSAGPDNESTQSVTFEIVDLDVGSTPNLFSVPPAIGANGNLTFTPGPNQFGVAHVTVRAKDDGGLNDYGLAGQIDPPDDTSEEVAFDINVTPVNDSPVAGDDAVTVLEDHFTTFTGLLSNDTDIDSPTLRIYKPTNGLKGTTSVDPTRVNVSYSPFANVYGSDTFTYVVQDGPSLSSGSDLATVTVTIIEVNDDPTAYPDGYPTRLLVPKGAGPTALPVLANDSSNPDPPETLRIASVTQPAHGAVSITGGGTGLTYDPVDTYIGPDEFTYTIEDGRGGVASSDVYVGVGGDFTPPVAMAPRVVIAAKVGASSVRANISWSATDTQSGISLYQLQQQVDGGAWTTISLPTATTTRILRTLATGSDYRFRVRAKDSSNNLGVYTDGRLIHL